MIMLGFGIALVMNFNWKRKIKSDETVEFLIFAVNEKISDKFVFGVFYYFKPLENENLFLYEDFNTKITDEERFETDKIVAEELEQYHKFLKNES